jgi:hypothetical protein
MDKKCTPLTWELHLPALLQTIPSSRSVTFGF